MKKRLAFIRNSQSECWTFSELFFEFSFEIVSWSRTVEVLKINFTRKMETRKNRNPVASKFKNNGKDRKLKAEERRKEKSKQIRNARKAKIDEKRNILSEKSLNENEEEGKQKKSVDGGKQTKIKNFRILQP